MYEKTDLGVKAESFMRQGQLVPDDLVINMIISETSSLTSSILLDGFPRNIAQAKSLQQRLPINAVVVLEIPHQTIIDRLSNRWIHASSGRTYAYDYNPPKHFGRDDVTGEALIQREDDKPETIKARLHAYEQQTRPLIEFYSAQKGSIRFNSFSGTESDIIYPEVKNFFKKWTIN